MAFGQASAPAPYPPWVSWAIHQGMIKAASEWDALLPQVQLAIKNKYLADEAARLGVSHLPQVKQGLAAMQTDLQDHLNGLAGIPMFAQKRTTGPYIPMSTMTDNATNRHNKWFAKMAVDPIMLLGLRLRMGEGEPPLPFKFYTSYCNESYVWISYVVENDMITLKDDAHLFPSDELIATLKLAIEAFSR